MVDSRRKHPSIRLYEWNPLWIAEFSTGSDNHFARRPPMKPGHQVLAAGLIALVATAAIASMNMTKMFASTSSNSTSSGASGTNSPTSATSSSATNAAQTATPQADLTASATISVSPVGSADAQFHQSELSYNTPLYGTSSWHGFLRQSARDITITLPESHKLNTVSIQMKQTPSLGIYFPNEVDFQVYNNGTWYKVEQTHPAIPPTNIETNVQTFSANLSGITAQKVRIHFPVDVWVFARNVTVTGNPQKATADSAPATLTPVAANDNQPLLATAPTAHGISNMLLVYTGSGNAKQSVWSTSDFLPMVAHQKQDGTLDGPMFDTFLFLPYNSLADTQTSWENYVSDLFASNQQLDALNAAVAQANQALGTPNRKANIVLSMPYPQFGDGNWGTIAGQGINFNGNAGDPVARGARDHAMNWYLTLLMNDWKQSGLSNLQLTGLYWDNEQVDYSQPGEVQLVHDAVGDAHQDSLPLFWIPFYDASGLDSWKSMGFDAAWLQPNYVEQGTSNISRLTDAEKLAANYGLGMELEVASGAITQSAATFYENTLSQLTQDEFGGGVSHAFYAGSKGLVQGAQSTQPYLRAVYDDTWNFIQNTEVK